MDTLVVGEIPLGKGLFEQISESNKRVWNVQTGEAGMRMFFHAMKVESLMQMLGALVTENRVNQEESTRIQEMIKSPDHENVTMAELIMEQYDTRKPNTTSLDSRSTS
jgi:hypothetical protein